MPLLAPHMHAKPSDTLDTSHDACSASTVLETSILFNVKLEVAGKRVHIAVGSPRAGVANPRKLGPKRCTLCGVQETVTLLQCLVTRPN